ncbi:hypothetical protein LOK48_06550 (plasmid) [Wolbachia endosymbiont of Corcyra cephalonica]|nr:hypothetical protein LOK48_06550 [Wolbachia endosymbiont of Corcyra cephalonica]
MLIADITDDCILGLDFLKNNGCIVEFAKGVVRFKDQDVFLQGSQPCKLYCLKDTTLAPRSENLVEVKFPKTMKKGLCVMVEDSGEHPSCITARTLVMTSNRAKVRIINLSNSEVHLKRNSAIGKCEGLNYLQRLNRVTSPTYTEEHSRSLLETSKENLSSLGTTKGKRFTYKVQGHFCHW